jgi:inosine-uridine nucleoside N-ribohydrolase
MSCRTTLPVLLVIGFVILSPCRAAEPGAAKLPILYSTDLFLPPDDPDDHYDLATLFAMREFDIRGIILDQGAKQKQKTGRGSVEQMLHITKRQVPCVVGLGGRLSSRTDKALEQPAEFQGAVELILKVLRESPEKVTIFTTGSCRDVAAAFNRQPQLFQSKVRAYYANAGDGPAGVQKEYNVGLDTEAYARIFEMGVPLYWCPCFGRTATLRTSAWIRTR